MHVPGRCRAAGTSLLFLESWAHASDSFKKLIHHTFVKYIIGRLPLRHEFLMEDASGVEEKTMIIVLTFNLTASTWLHSLDHHVTTVFPPGIAWTTHTRSTEINIHHRKLVSLSQMFPKRFSETKLDGCASLHSHVVTDSKRTNTKKHSLLTAADSKLTDKITVASKDLKCLVPLMANWCHC